MNPLKHKHGKLLLGGVVVFVVLAVLIATQTMTPAAAKAFTRRITQAGAIALAMLSGALIVWSGPLWAGAAVAIGALYASGAWELAAPHLGLPGLGGGGGASSSAASGRDQCTAAGGTWRCPPRPDGTFSPQDCFCEMPQY